MKTSPITSRLVVASCDMPIPMMREISSSPSSGSPESRNSLARFAASRSALVCHLRVGIEPRQAQCAGEPLEEIELEPRQLGDLPAAVALALRLEHQLGGKQGESSLRDGLLQLLKRHPGLGQVAQQREPRLARLAVQLLEQALGLEVDLCHAAILA